MIFFYNGLIKRGIGKEKLLKFKKGDEEITQVSVALKMAILQEEE